MTLLEVVQRFCTRTGIPSPAFVVASTDAQIKQIQGLIDELCEEFSTRLRWSGLTLEASFTTVAAEDQGALTTIAPGISGTAIDNETIFNRTLRLPVYGPMPGDKWQALKALPTTGPFYKYRIRGGRLLFNPAPPAGHSCAFEYRSKMVVVAVDGVTIKPYPTADDDSFLIDDVLLLAGLRWLWKKEKGLPYAEEFTRFEQMFNDQNARDGSKPRLSMDGSSSRGAYPGVFISPFNTVP